MGALNVVQAIFGKGTHAQPNPAPPLPTLLALCQPMVLGRASQLSLLPLGPVTNDK